MTDAAPPAAPPRFVSQDEANLNSEEMQLLMTIALTSETLQNAKDRLAVVRALKRGVGMGRSFQLTEAALAAAEKPAPGTDQQSEA